MINHPNLFIVGVPKSGTTSMHIYLAEHPEIFMSPVKEPYYFAPDLKVSWRIADNSQYLSLFNSEKNAKYFGESSTGYMYSKLAAQNIKKFCPDAKIIIMLRHPVDMLYSLHGQLLSTGHENILDFEEALASANKRQQGSKIPISCEEPKLLLYFDIVRYSEQLKRYLELFDRLKNIHIILFDDFCQDPKAIYIKTLEFLGVDSNCKLNFNIHNPAPSIPNIYVREFLCKNPGLKTAPYKFLHPNWRNWLKTNLNKLQQQRPKQIDPELRFKLTQIFQPEIQELAGLLKRDLTHWVSLD
ncbi:sulfotransferase [Sphaerospermopsis aphanizomenoides BCCUSP55]|uniref:sulfotransferase family protein n=1 Tax=Sphaerospermopsis aphanizomenoides TaxID=459663 RepID=UPI00190612E4|nr:sulfotransferase [Sphaerospermopsis aphanizomenoides]MBK1988965.1 sulfotransferase [Sphaerospermopsis aphanizomenoides BCCUSP55]